ncbi:putative methyltransferase C9orf114 homolog [Symsagittifera roscoffensis]|uniref:putative methyltransferase C9orf114 homolog n=1 Tax=Symsagittifera roscoffensis TaxID=84072 RepID=UPI00307B1CB3
MTIRHNKRPSSQALDDAVAQSIRDFSDPIEIEEELLVRTEQPTTQMSILPDVSKSSKLANEKIQRKHKTNVSLALAGSILNNVSTLQLKTLLAGQIGRYSAIFRIVEIVIFDDHDAGSGYVDSTKEACALMRKLLEYQVMPQYMRKSLFGIDQDLAFASLLHPLATPHHMKMDDFSKYRDGLTLDRKSAAGFTMANCGLGSDVVLDRKLKPGICVTVKFEKDDWENGEIVSPKEPFKNGYYWGYSIRTANCMDDIFSHPNGAKYDLVLGTSDKGELLTDINLPDVKTMLIVVGGVQGLEFAFENDEKNASSDCATNFDFYVNCCANQGSRTIRTEEALPIILTSVNEKINFL